MTDNIEVLVPIWALKAVIDRDWEAWSIFNHPERGIHRKIQEPYQVDITPDDTEEDNTEPFPELDSTAQILKTLESHNIHFDSYTGEWS